MIGIAPAMAEQVPTLHFSSAASPEHTAVKALMEKEGSVTIQDKFLEIAPIDLDLDGTPELFAMATNADYFCGDAGCVPRIYKRDGNGWKQIDIGLNDFINGDPADWSVERKPENGHLVLVLTESHFTSRYIWDGSAYSSAD